MRKLHALTLFALLPLAACGNNDPAPSTDAGGQAGTAAPANTALGRKIQEAMAEASRELANENIRVGEESGEPKAEISPQGDFIVGGKPVAVDEAQRTLLLAHRANLVAVAQAGIAVGMQGADLGLEGGAGVGEGEELHGDVLVWRVSDSEPALLIREVACCGMRCSIGSSLNQYSFGMLHDNWLCD